MMHEPQLDPTTGALSVGDRSVRLTSSEQAILRRLMRSKGEVVSKECLFDTLYGDAVDDEPALKIIDVFVCKIRGKLASIGVDSLIATVWGRGYRIAGSAVRITLGLSETEWSSLQVIVAGAGRQNAVAAALVRDAMQRAEG